VPHRVRRLPQADEDIFDIWANIATDSPTAADRLVQRFYAAEDLIAQFPEIGEARPDLAPEIRKWTVGAYLMFYRVTEDTVLITRVIYGARDLPSALDD
jgi:toxin ParE1/3/4